MRAAGGGEDPATRDRRRGAGSGGSGDAAGALKGHRARGTVAILTITASPAGMVAKQHLERMEVAARVAELDRLVKVAATLYAARGTTSATDTAWAADIIGAPFAEGSALAPGDGTSVTIGAASTSGLTGTTARGAASGVDPTDAASTWVLTVGEAAGTNHGCAPNAPVPAASAGGERRHPDGTPVRRGVARDARLGRRAR